MSIAGVVVVAVVVAVAVVVVVMVVASKIDSLHLDCSSSFPM